MDPILAKLIEEETKDLPKELKARIKALAEEYKYNPNTGHYEKG